MNNFLGKLRNIKPKTILDGLRKAAPECLIAGGIGLLFTAIYTCGNNAPEAEKEVEEKRAMYEAEGKEMPKGEVVLTHAKHQIVTIALAITGTAAIVGANSIQHKRNVALALALQAGEAYSAELETKIKKLVGKEPVEQAKKEMEEQKTKMHYNFPTNFDDDVECIIEDAFTGTRFKRRICDVERAMLSVNGALCEGESVSVYDFYSVLDEADGMTPSNQLIGWTGTDKADFLIDLSWFSELEGRRPIVRFEYSTNPAPDFRFTA